MAERGTCKSADCEKPVVGKGYCAPHYRKWKQGELPKARYKTCVEENCLGRQVARARCAKHAGIEIPVAAEAAAAPSA